MENVTPPRINIQGIIYEPSYSIKNDNTPKFWAKVFDSFYEKIPDTQNAPLDTSVWKSSYDGSLFSKEEMDDWIANAINKIKTYINPKTRVLEIGCGNGIIFSRIIKEVELYAGCDIAKSALSSIGNSADGMKHSSKIRLYQIAANEINSIEGEYDLIIINSVAQYFPDLNYFFEFLECVHNKLSENGVCFFGDIRSYELSQAFYDDIAKLKFPDQKEKAIEYAERLKKKDSETLYSKKFFLNLKLVFPWIRSISITDKVSNFSNEMSRFRYDVFLLKSGQEQPVEKTEHISSYSNHISELINKQIVDNNEVNVVSLHPKLFKLVQLYGANKK